MKIPMTTALRHDLAEMDLHELEQALESMGHARFHARQLFQWVHKRGVTDFGGMTDLGRELRAGLASAFRVATPEVVRKETSSDGTTKFLLRLSDGQLIESVFIPDTPANTFCLSTQVGCAMRCGFCLTGRMGIVRNLTAGEIVGQLYAVLDDRGRQPRGARVVFMGMGEPFLNPEGVIGALGVLFEVMSPRRVTVSTSGITPAFDEFARLPRRPNLAVSLNAADEDTRTRIMPITKTYPLAGVLRAMRRWPLEPRRRITAEYVLIAGVNDSPADADRLARLLSGIPVKVNVIPLNEDPTYLPGWKRPDEAAIDRFVERLARARVTATVRRSRGPDASAACGQLKGRTEDPRRKIGDW